MSDRGAGPGWTEEPAVELLTSSDDRERLDERFDTGVRHGGRLVRRHPWWVSAVVVVLAGSAAFTVWWTGRPPPESAEVDIQIDPLGGQGQYVAVLRTPGERVHVLGIVGPGLIDPSSTMGAVTSTGPGIGNIGATIDCTQGRWWEARPGDYVVSVQRTDAYGRTGTYAVAPRGGDYWWDRVYNQCLELALFDLPPATVVSTVRERSHAVEVVLRVGNPHEYALHFEAVGAEEGFVSWSGGTPVDLAAGSVADLSILMTVDCGHGRPQLVTHTYSTASEEYNGPGIAVKGQLPDDLGDLFSAGSSLLRVEAGSAQVIDDALAAACP